VLRKIFCCLPIPEIFIALLFAYLATPEFVCAYRWVPHGPSYSYTDCFYDVKTHHEYCLEKDAYERDVFTRRAHIIGLSSLYFGLFVIVAIGFERIYGGRG
jgi:hypothetical protein